MFYLPQLPYDYDALEPAIDARTMEIHYTKHHQGYTNKFNQALEGHELASAPIETILGQVSQLSPAIRNNGGGFYNHNLFWQNLAPVGSTELAADLEEVLQTNFGSVAEFKQQFSEAAATRFGSGWAWLVQQDDGRLIVGSTPNQDNPLMDDVDFKGRPLLALDVWEHAYYLKYQNRRVDYIQSFWEIVNWPEVAKRLSRT